MIGLAELLAQAFSAGESGVSSMSAAVEGVLASSGVWSSTLMGFFFLNGGLASNLVLICLSIVGVYVIGRERPWGVFLPVLVFLSSLVFIFGDAVIKTRLVYNIPLHFFAAVGLDSVKEEPSPILFFFVVIYSLFYVFIFR